MVTSFLEHEEIVTTEAKAKELRRVAEKMITWGKANNLSAKREVMRVVRSEDVMKKLFDTIAPRFATRLGGYTRIIKIGARLGDATEMVMIKLV
jgi:large subunit ribosomal protein L17